MLVAAAVGLIVLAMAWVFARAITSPNDASCNRVQPGITVADLVRELDGPHYYRRGTDTWVSFDTPLVASRSIEARYDSMTGVVLELWCGQENEPQWRQPPTGTDSTGQALEADRRKAAQLPMLA